MINSSHFPFCGRKGAVVPDSFTIQDYLQECLGVISDSNDLAEQADLIKQINTKEAPSLDIYMKDVPTSQELNAVSFHFKFGIES